MEYIDYFKAKIEDEYGTEVLSTIIDNLKEERVTTFRVNTLKISISDAYNILVNDGFKLQQVDFYDAAFILLNKSIQELEKTNLYNDGMIYIQSLSSMLPPLILNPGTNIDILDMAAAPGGKTTELAVLTNNQARITACELNKIRAERLQYNVNKQQASSVYVLNQDSRRLDSFFSFDSILLDAPCSGSGTRVDLDSFKGLTEALVSKSVKSQIELLKIAIDHLKVGGSLVYSTCSIFKEENEEIVSKAISGKNVIIEQINFNSKNAKVLPSSLNGVLTLMPNKYFEGFFIAKITKKGK